MKNGQLMRQIVADPYRVQTPMIAESAGVELVNGARLSALLRLRPSATTDTRLGVEIVARYFRREFDYDFPPYEAGEEVSAAREIYLLAEKFWSDNGRVQWRVLGVIGLHRGFYSNLPADQWTMTWAWLHPLVRDKGRLSEVWPALVKRHGPLIAQTPLSSAMRGFLAKRQVASIPLGDVNVPLYGVPESATPQRPCMDQHQPALAA